MVWFALSESCTAWPLFYDMLTADHCLHTAQKEFCTFFCKECYVNLRYTFFLQDKALPHSLHSELNVLSGQLSDHFPELLAFGCS
jgi:hypothetical protein